LRITDENNLKIGEYCGKFYGKEIIVGAEYAVLTFHSNNKVQKKGFRIIDSTVNASKFYSSGVYGVRFHENDTSKRS